MRLVRFRVTNFRSVDDSGWIEVDRVTALIGTNESGKSNLLLPLWKLNPAKDGELKPTADYPRKRYNEIRVMESKPIFIRAQFELSDDVAKVVAGVAAASIDDIRLTEVTRDLAGKYAIGFPDATVKRTMKRAAVVERLESTRSEVERVDVPKNAEDLRAEMLAAIAKATAALPQGDTVTLAAVTAAKAALDAVTLPGTSTRNPTVPYFEQLREKVGEFETSIAKPHPQSIESARKLVMDSLPHFVYYASYGNLDSEIYLPHVIDNMARTDLGQKEEAKARTLKVLFEFVKLSPEEIRELGRDKLAQPQHGPTADEIREGAERRKERDILLQSAGTELTAKFREWWAQGEYRFRFQADGDHFRIWVSDDRRPEDIELEGRSTGLQWFLSFYLVFLVESRDAHADAVLLLDEPGHSLHPLAQRDLSKFFDNLASTNQLVYTSHSPFLLDHDQLDRVKAVYVKPDGTTGVSEDLRASGTPAAQVQSAYPAHAALGLNVSETFLLGCKPIIVEGVSDQNYLSAIKTLLISGGHLRPSRELVFLPAGGVKGVKAIVTMVSGKDDELPIVLLDGDSAGRDLAKSLKKGLYAGADSRVILLEGLTPGMADPEVEDLIALELIADVATRSILRGPEEDFSESVSKGAAVVPQMEDFAQRHALTLETPGWKVDLSKRVKARLLNLGHDSISTSVLEAWRVLFDRLLK